MKNRRKCHAKKYRNIKKTKNINNTLVIFGIRNEVTKADIYDHFVGCTKVTIKQSYLPPYLKYSNNYYVF
jgi:RNA recognition motif-containing protein